MLLGESHLPIPPFAAQLTIINIYNLILQPSGETMTYFWERPNPPKPAPVKRPSLAIADNAPPAPKQPKTEPSSEAHFLLAAPLKVEESKMPPVKMVSQYISSLLIFIQ